eukprot:TRINITY_DN13795_c0_g1_i1.p1 TRINITY_DN13795_c0_g1~~TRINITY_DN13795_c0_g1_i1.p1  ORF type:complete len:224 (-),score=46.79 TRINITY_DN13795_c0_g1_i1:250-921(-)
MSTDDWRKQRKRKAIEGVSAGSVVDLKAALFQSEAIAQARKAGQIPKRPKGTLKDTLGGSNRGVQDRAERDRNERGPVSGHEPSVKASLTAKAQIYEKLRQAAPTEADMNDPQYLIDFERKMLDRRPGDRDYYESDTLAQEEAERQRRLERNAQAEAMTVQTAQERDRLMQLRIEKKAAHKQRLEAIKAKEAQIEAEKAVLNLNQERPAIQMSFKLPLKKMTK